jgi:hypothetical protein
MACLCCNTCLLLHKKRVNITELSDIISNYKANYKITYIQTEADQFERELEVEIKGNELLCLGCSCKL